MADFPLKEFPAADYKLVVSILDGGGRQLLAVDKIFSVSPFGRIPRPQIFSKITSLAQGALVPYITGMQHLNRGAVTDAVELLETAYHRNPGVIDFALGLSRAYLLSRQYDKVEPILAPFLETEKPDEDVIYRLAEAQKSLGQYEEAAKRYKQILSGFGASLDVLNSLGFCYYRLGDLTEARTAWIKSLEINPNQPEIRELLDSLGKR